MNAPEFLYLHVPFCLRRCPYCDFAVEPSRRPPVEDWLEAVDSELQLARESNGWSEPLHLRTIYVGGGTPSLLGPEGMGALRGRLERHARWDDREVEWTAEANPETFTHDVAREWHHAGVNRVSLGVQSFHAPTLRWMGRLHGADGAVASVDAARAADIENVSLDLIFALPERLGRHWDDDLRQALALEPAHLSLYGLTAEPGTPLFRWIREGRETMTGEDAYASEYLLAVERAEAAGLAAYEVSNFARPGRESRHNSAYWSGQPYLGLGPGAHSFLPPHRAWNRRDWKGYRADLSEGRSPGEGAEVVGVQAARLERTWLGLRTAAGLSADSLSPTQHEIVERWRSEGLAADGSVAVRLTPRGWLLLDRLAVELDDAA